MDSKSFSYVAAFLGAKPYGKYLGLSCSYAVLWNAFKKLATGFSAAEKASVFHDTAAEAYRLGA